jgi:hypothetical protein
VALAEIVILAGATKTWPFVGERMVAVGGGAALSTGTKPRHINNSTTNGTSDLVAYSTTISAVNQSKSQGLGPQNEQFSLAKATFPPPP